MLPGKICLLDPLRPYKLNSLFIVTARIQKKFILKKFRVQSSRYNTARAPQTAASSQRLLVLWRRNS